MREAIAQLNNASLWKSGFASDQTITLTLFPMVAVGLETWGAGGVGAAAFVPSLSPSASVPTRCGCGAGCTLWGLTLEMLDMGWLSMSRVISIYRPYVLRSETPLQTLRI
jgi:hypothetical protein